MTPNESPRAANTGALDSQCQVVVSPQGTPESTVTSAATVIAAVDQDDFDTAAQERIAHLNPQWKWAITQTERYGWELFPANNRVPTTPDWPADQIDWSKRPRRMCLSCKAAGEREHDPVKGHTCYAQCGHRLCHGFIGATRDIDQLITWAEQFPNANVCVRTGTGSNLFVVDVDGPEGEARLRALLAENGDNWDEVCRYQTGGGTWHYLFDYPQDRTNPFRRDGKWRNSSKSKLGPGLDTRGDGGYIVLPGSNSRKGAYRVDRAIFRGPVPEWVLAKLSAVTVADQPTRGQRRDAVAAVDFSGAPDGVHPYAARAFTERVAEFRSLVGSDNGRNAKLVGGAMYLSRIANSATPSGLTEEMIRDAYTDAVHANGYFDTHPHWSAEIDHGIEDGHTAGDPRNWPPAEQMSDTDRMIGEIIASGDSDQLARLEEALPGEFHSHRTRHNNGSRAHPAPVPATSVPVESDPPEPDQAPAPTASTAPSAPAATEPSIGLVTTAVPDDAADGGPLRAEIARLDAEILARDPDYKPPSRRPAIAVGTNDNPRDFSEVRKAVQKALGVNIHVLAAGVLESRRVGEVGGWVVRDGGWYQVGAGVGGRQGSPVRALRMPARTSTPCLRMVSM